MGALTERLAQLLCKYDSWNHANQIYRQHLDNPQEHVSSGGCSICQTIRSDLDDIRMFQQTREWQDKE